MVVIGMQVGAPTCCTERLKRLINPLLVLQHLILVCGLSDTLQGPSVLVTSVVITTGSQLLALCLLHVHSQRGFC